MQTKFAIRAAQLDLARQMETVDFIRDFIDFIAEYHYNTLFLYLEWRIRTKTFDIGESEGYSADQIREIVAYAAARGIDVIPGLNTFGHADLLFAKPEFQHLAELRGGRIGRWGTHALIEFCPSLPETRPFIENYLTEVAALFPSRYLSISGDEVDNIGYCELCQKKVKNFADEEALVLEHFRFCHSIVSGKLKKRMLVADDMFEWYPDAFRQLPKDIIFLTWQYQRQAVNFLGHFSNLGFSDQLAYYEMAGFDYLLLPADYYWSNAESLTAYAASQARRHCMGGLLTMWEKRYSLLYKNFPIFAAVGNLWSGQAGSADELRRAALEKLFPGGNRALFHTLESYMDNPDKGAAITAGRFTNHDFEGPESGVIPTLRLLSDALEAGTKQEFPPLCRKILSDTLTDVQFMEANARAILSAWKQLHDEEAEPMAAIARDVEKLWDGNIAFCRQERTEQDAGFFVARKQDNLQKLSDFTENIQTRSRLTLTLCLPDGYAAEQTAVRILAGGKWIEAASGVFKKTGSPLNQYTVFLPAAIVPEELELACHGFGGQGICYASLKTPRGEYIPDQLLAFEGEVWHPEHVLASDVTFAWLGPQKILDGFHDRAVATARHRIRISMKLNA